MNTRKRFFALSPAEVSEEDPGCTEVIWKELFERRREAEENAFMRCSVVTKYVARNRL